MPRREAAATFGASPILVAASSTHAYATSTRPGQNTDADGYQDSRLGSSPMGARERGSRAEDLGVTKSGGGFELEGLRSALLEVSGMETPSRRPARRPARRPGRSTLHTPSMSGYERNGGSNNKNSIRETRQKYIGLLGEVYIDKRMSEILPCWDISNWTSRSRVEIGHPSFSGMERDYADFTYKDVQGFLAQILIGGDFKRAERWRLDPARPVTYHLEVKATTGECGEPFYMSNKQVEKARSYAIPQSGVPADVYVVLRVFNFGNPRLVPDFKTYVDPWSMYPARDLIFTASDKYAVMPG